MEARLSSQHGIGVMNEAFPTAYKVPLDRIELV